MRVFLVQQGLFEALEGKFNLHIIMAEKEKKMLMEKAHNVIVLILGNKVLRKVYKEKTSTGVWTKLESLLMKFLVNRLYLKETSYKINSEKIINEQLDQ